MAKKEAKKQTIVTLKKSRARKEKKAKPFIEGIKATEIQDVPIEDINLEDFTFQYRLSANLGDLKRSLVREGQKEPVDLTGSKPYRIIDGFRRIRAIQALGWSTVKALIHRGISDEEAHKLAFIKNVVRKNLSAMDRANAIWQAEQRGAKPSQLAELLGLSEKQVGRYKALLDFPGHVRKLLEKGTINMGQAKVFSDFQVSDKDITDWVEKIKATGLSAKQLKRELKKSLGIKFPGRPKLYMKKTKEGFRMYPFTINRDAPEADKKKVIKVLKEALGIIKG